jgi:hypothetical protein
MILHIKTFLLRVLVLSIVVFAIAYALCEVHIGVFFIALWMIFWDHFVDNQHSMLFSLMSYYSVCFAVTMLALFSTRIKRVFLSITSHVF